MKTLAVALLVSGLFVATSDGHPVHPAHPVHPVRGARDQRAVAVPEPSTLLLSMLGMGSVLAVGMWFRRQ